jgi:hypothetical protein
MPAVLNKSAIFSARAQVGNLTRTCQADDPVLLDARHRMREAAFLIAIGKAIDRMPDLTPRGAPTRHQSADIVARGLR